MTIQQICSLIFLIHLIEQQISFQMHSAQLTPNQIPQIEKLIDNAYSIINSTPNLTFETKANLYFSIIEQKKLINNNHHMYLDAKNFIANYFSSIHSQDFGYDKVSIKKLSYIIEMFPHSKRETLYKAAMHNAKTNGLEDLVPIIEQKLHDTHLALAKRALYEKKNLKSFASLLLLLATRNYTTILVSILLMIIAVFIILLPTNNPQLQLFTYEHIRITDQFLLDHFLNVVLLILGLNDDIKVSPISAIGAAIICFGRLVYLLFIVNIIIKQLEKKMSI